MASNKDFESYSELFIVQLDAEKEKRTKKENEIKKEKYEKELKRHETNIKELLFGKAGIFLTFSISLKLNIVTI